MRTRKINKTIVAVLAICTAFLISSMYFIPSNAETEITGDLVTWGDAENPNLYNREDEDASQWSRPTKDGYYFAGWYETTESTEAIANIADIDSAYPKFVRKDALSVFCQVALKNAQGTYTSSQANGSVGFAQVDVRVMTSVDTLQYQQVSFLLGTNQSKCIPVDTVYKKVTGSKVNADVVEYDATDVCSAYAEGEGYLAAGYISNLKSYVRSDGNDSFESNIVITPTWTTMDGTVVKGETANKQVVMDERVKSCEAKLDYKANDVDQCVWYYEFTNAQTAAQKQEGDVKVTLRKDITLSDALYPITKDADGTYTLDGAEKIINVSNLGTTTPFNMNHSSYSGCNFVLQNVTVNHNTTSNAVLLTSKGKDVSVTFDGVTVNSTAGGTAKGGGTDKSLGYGLMVFAGTSSSARATINLTLNNTNITWNPTSTTSAHGIIVFNYVKSATINVAGTSSLSGEINYTNVYWRNYKSSIDSVTVNNEAETNIMTGQITHSNGTIY